MKEDEIFAATASDYEDIDNVVEELQSKVLSLSKTKQFAIAYTILGLPVELAGFQINQRCFIPSFYNQNIQNCEDPTSFCIYCRRQLDSETRDECRRCGRSVLKECGGLGSLDLFLPEEPLQFQCCCCMDFVSQMAKDTY